MKRLARARCSRPARSRSAARRSRRLRTRPRSKNAAIGRPRLLRRRADDRDAAHARAGARAVRRHRDRRRRRRLGAAIAGKPHSRSPSAESPSSPPWTPPGQHPSHQPSAVSDSHRDPAVDGLRHRPSRHDAAVPGGAADARPDGPSVLDVGTGSGVLAIAAAGSAPRDALGIDFDADAIQSARENLDAESRRRPRHASRSIDLRGAAAAAGRLVTANLTGALLVRSARRCSARLRAGGTLILSAASRSHERDEVRRGVRRRAADPGSARRTAGSASR